MKGNAREWTEEETVEWNNMWAELINNIEEVLNQE